MPKPTAKKITIPREVMDIVVSYLEDNDTVTKELAISDLEMIRYNAGGVLTEAEQLLLKYLQNATDDQVEFVLDILG